MPEDFEKLKKTRLVWKSRSHHLIMDPRLTRSADRSRGRHRPQTGPYTSSPIRPGSVPPRPKSQSNGSLTPSPVDNDQATYRARDRSATRRTHFCDGIDTHGRQLDRDELPKEMRFADDCVRDSVHECNMIKRLSPLSDDLHRRLEHSQAEAAMLEANRRELMSRLREAELDGRAASRQVTELQEIVRNLRNAAAASQTAADVNELARQKEELAHRLEIFEDSNRHLRDLLRTADFETGRLKAFEDERDDAKRRIFCLESEVSRLTKQLADSESTRANLQRQIHSREADIERMTVQLRNVEKKYGRDAQEIMSNYEQLKRATRGWKQKWQKAEEDLEESRKALQCADEDAVDKAREMQRRLELAEEDRERTRMQLEECMKRAKDVDGMLNMSRSGERELTAEMGSLDRRLREACGEIEALKRRNCELVCELESAADREVQSRMGQEQASREFDVLRERMATRCGELEDLVTKLRNGGVSAQEARDCVLEMRLQRTTDELDCLRCKHSEMIRRLEDAQLAYNQTKATNRSLLDYISRLRKSYNDNFGQLAAEACPTLTGTYH